MILSIDLRMIESSGIGTYISNLLPLIIDKSPHFFFNLLGDRETIGGRAWSRRPNVTIIDCRSPIYSLAEQAELVKKIPRDTDLFWSPHFNIPLFYPGKLLVTVHDVFHLAMKRLAGGPHKRLYARAMFKAVGYKAQTVLCVSRFTQSELIKYTEIDPGIIKPIHLGVSSDWFTIPKDEAPHQRPYLLYVGNVKPHKNLVRLLQAFKTLADKIPHDLIIVGKKEGFITGDKTVVRAADEFAGRVVFTGHVSEERLKRYYAFADALILPSLYEGFGLPVLEAMASGCPVIASNVASLPEVCGDAALYCDPYNPTDIASKITMLLEERGLAEGLREKGLVQARQYSWDRCAAETVEILEKIVG